VAAEHVAGLNIQVTVRNVGQQKVTGCSLLAGSQHFTQKFLYSPVGAGGRCTLSQFRY
jgi:hypothetical protein